MAVCSDDLKRKEERAETRGIVEEEEDLLPENINTWVFDLQGNVV